MGDLAPRHIGAYLTIEPGRHYPGGMLGPRRLLDLERRGSYVRLVTYGRDDNGKPFRRVDIVHGTAECTVWDL